MTPFGHHLLDTLHRLIDDALTDFSPKMDNPKETATELIWEFVDQWGGQQVYVPQAQVLKNSMRDAQIIKAYQSGIPVHDLAKNHKLSEARIYQILQDHEKSDPRQQNLFK